MKVFIIKLYTVKKMRAKLASKTKFYMGFKHLTFGPFIKKDPVHETNIFLFMGFHFRREFMLQHVSDPGCRQYAHKKSTEYWQFGNAQRIWSYGGPHLAVTFIPDTSFVKTICKLS